MGRANRRRRGLRRVLRAMIRASIALGLLFGVLAAVAHGSPAWGMLMLPLGMFAMIAMVPMLLFALVVVALSLALPVVILAGMFGGPAYLLYRVFGGGRRSRHQLDDAESGQALSDDAVLRRRYVAGQITYQQFQAGMVGFLKERFARGELKLAEYEAELEALLAPARHLDVRRDPAIAGAPFATR